MTDSPAERQTGCLWIVGTPIGNLGDLSSRAIRVISDCDWILAEDTRQTRKILNHLGIRKKLYSFHEHNENRKTDMVLQKLLAGARIALVSDSGMPLVSDPGFPLVRAARTNGIEVEVVPGPAAFLTALVGSGFPVVPFMFGGFLPRKQHGRRRKIAVLDELEMTQVYYESPHRLAAAMADFDCVVGERQICLVRELTKIHEQWLFGTAAEISTDPAVIKPRGEFVIVVAPRKRNTKKSRKGSEDSKTRRMTDRPAKM